MGARARLVRSLVKTSRPHDPYELTATSHDMRMPLAHAHTLPAPLLRQTNSFGVGVVEKRHGGDTFPRNGDSCSRHHSLNICQPWGKFITFRRGVRVTGPGPGGLTAAVRGSLRGVIPENRYINRIGEHLGVLKIFRVGPRYQMFYERNR